MDKLFRSYTATYIKDDDQLFQQVVKCLIDVDPMVHPFKTHVLQELTAIVLSKHKVVLMKAVKVLTSDWKKQNQLMIAS